MHRLPFFLCVVALLGSAVSAVLFFRIGNSKQLLEQRLAEVSARAAQLDDDAKAASEHRNSLEAKLHARDVDVAVSRQRLTVSEARVVQLATDLKQTRDVLSFYEATARALGEEVAALRQDLDPSRSSNASPEAVAAYKAAIADLERQLASAREGSALPGSAAPSTAVFTNRAGRATILTVGPESSFVVLNFGTVRGAELGQRLTVSHGTSEVATVLISDVRPNFSVAQVLPDTLRGVLQKGDSAILIR